MSNLAEACQGVSRLVSAYPRHLVSGVGPGREGSQCFGAGPGRWRTEQDREESSARVQPLTAHPRQLVNGAGPGREISPGTASDSTPVTPGKRNRNRERDTASDSTIHDDGERSGAGERVQPGYSL